MPTATTEAAAYCRNVAATILPAAPTSLLQSLYVALGTLGYFATMDELDANADAVRAEGRNARTSGARREAIRSLATLSRVRNVLSQHEDPDSAITHVGEELLRRGTFGADGGWLAGRVDVYGYSRDRTQGQRVTHAPLHR